MNKWSTETKMLAGAIDSCKYLYLREINEPRDNWLRLAVEEATAGTELMHVLPGTNIEMPGQAIESNENCGLFNLVWQGYIAYSVRNESYTTVDPDERFSGRLFCLYSKSHFLDYVSHSTIASEDHPGPFQHVGIVCLNHVVDVVSDRAPEIIRLR
jgi:hypothetical protein